MLDVYSAAYQDNPYPLLAALQAETSFYYRAAAKDWLVLRHKDIRELLKDHHRLRSTYTAVHRQPDSMPATSPLEAMWKEANLFWRLSIPNTDLPVHTGMRRAIQKPFDEYFLADTLDFVMDRADLLLAQLAPQRSGTQPIDLVQDYAKPLLNQMIAHLFGLPQRLAQRMGDEALHLALAHDIGKDPRALTRAGHALLRFYSYFHSALPQMAQSGSRFVQGFLRAHAEQKLTYDELLAQLVLFYMVSQTTTQDLVTSALFHLLQNLGLRDEVTAQPGLIPRLVTETLRYESPVQYIARRSHEPIELFGHQIGPGVPILLMIGAAHHDPEVFDNPHRFDIHRETTPQQILSFGSGIHHCMGAHVSPVIAQIVLEKLLKAFPQIRLNPEQKPCWQKQFLLRGLDLLPVLL